MSERRVRAGSRQVYGRAEPLVGPRRRGVRRPAVGLVQRRLLMLMVVVAVAVWGVLKLFAINQVVVNSATHGDEIRSEVQKLLHDSWSQGNMLTLDEDTLVSKLQLADPLVRSVEVHRHLLHTLTLTATLKQPSMGWSSGNQRYLLDSDGTAIGVLGASSKLPVVNDGSNLPVTVGQQVTSRRFVEFVTAVVPALASAGIGTTGLNIKDTTFDLSVSTNKGYRIVLDTSRSVSDEMKDMAAVQRLLVAQKRVPAEYLDLRIAGKAYYK